MLHQALSLALKAHNGSNREGEAPLPYFTHPAEVLTNLRYIGGVTDSDLLCVAILHDVIEDSSVKLSEIQSKFGPRVASLVRELTRCEPTAAQTAGMNKAEIWALRSRMLLDEISKMSPQAQAVKLADRLSNIRDAKYTKQGAKLKRYRAQTRRILEIVPESVNPALWTAIRQEL